MSESCGDPLLQAAIEARYHGRQDVTGLGPATGMIELQLRHRSVRRFLDVALPEGTLETLVAAGQSASTSSNMQTTTVVAVTDRARLRRLARLCRNQPFIETSPLFLCCIADLSRAGRVGARIGADLHALPMLDTFITAATDCGIFAQNVALAAQSLGLGICFIGNLKHDPAAVARELALPPGAVALFGMCIGVPDPTLYTGIRPRLPQQVVLHRETYSTRDEPAELDRYDRIFAAHEQSQNREPAAWTARHRDRFADEDYIGDRKRMKSVLRAMGFGLD